MDLDPFAPLGIETPTMRLLDVFLLHCLLAPSPEDTPEEIAALGANQHDTAARGREPGRRLARGGAAVVLTEWADELLAQCTPIAATLDAVFGGSAYREALAAARHALGAPQTLPSARVLAAMRQDFAGSYTRFIRAQAEQTRGRILALPWSAEQQAAFGAMAKVSHHRREALEADDTLDFESWRLAYLDPARLLPG